MPVQECQSDGQPGYRWGEEGKCYTYTPSDEESRKAARAKAERQGRAVEAHTSELDGSLGDFISNVRQAFEKQFPPVRQAGSELALPRYWVRDVFEDHVVIEDGPQLYRVDFSVEDGEVTFAARNDWTKVRLSYIQEYMIGEFRGDFPEVPVAAGVDLEALKADDANPFFVTLPVARVGETSANGLLYDEDLVKTIVESVNTEHPTGIMGHLTPEQMDTAYPVPDVFWVGATRQNGTAWAKGYVPPGAARDTLRRLKAVGGKAATSIFGPPGRRVPLGDGKWKVDGFKLQSLDLAPYDRAALKLGGQFAVTAEMDSYTDDREGTMLTREQIIAELTVKDVPATLREQILRESREAQAHEQQIAELQQQVRDRDTVVETLRGQLAEYQLREFNATLDGLVGEYIKLESRDDAGRAKVAALRSLFRSRLVAEIGQERDPEKIKATAKRLWEAELQVVAETIRDALAGPAAVMGGQRRNTRQIEDTPEARARARAEIGI